LKKEEVLKKKRAREQKKGYWDDIENRRKFLLSFARERGFDPSVKASWKGKAKLQANQVHPCFGFLRRYSNFLS